VTRAQLDILLRRLRRGFRRSHIVIGYWDGSAEGRTEEAESEGMRYAASVSALVDLVGREMDQRATPAQVVHHLEAAANA
jgi:hypothetical protein